MQKNCSIRKKEAPHCVIINVVSGAADNTQLLDITVYSYEEICEEQVETTVIATTLT